MRSSASRRAIAWTSLCAGVALAAGALDARQQATFSGGTNVVMVDVQVLRSSAPVEGLTATDFTVRDSGVAQEVRLVGVDGLPVQLLLTLDTSASVRGPLLDHLKQAAKAAVASLRPADQAALLTFGHSVNLRASWTADRAQLDAAIDQVTAQGGTALTDAAFASLGLAAQPGARRLVLVFTDGDDTASWLSTADVLQMARRSESVVYGVTLSTPGHSGADIAEWLASPRAASAGSDPAAVEKWLLAEPGLYRGALLPMLARTSGGELLRSIETAALRDAFAAIVARFNRRYVLSYSPTGVPATGWHPIEVEVRGGGEVTARRGYTR